MKSKCHTCYICDLRGDARRRTHEVHCGDSNWHRQGGKKLCRCCLFSTIAARNGDGSWHIALATVCPLSYALPRVLKRWDTDDETSSWFVCARVTPFSKLASPSSLLRRQAFWSEVLITYLTTTPPRSTDGSSKRA